MLLSIVLACSAATPRVQVRDVPGGLEVVADRPLDRVEVVTSRGVRIGEREGIGERSVAFAFRPPRAARWQVRVALADGSERTLDAHGEPFGLEVAVEAPLGGTRIPVGDEDTLELVAGARAAVVLRAHQRTPAFVRVEHDVRERPLDEGETWIVPVSLDDEVELLAGDGRATIEVELRPHRLTMDALRRSITVHARDRAADGFGRPTAEGGRARWQAVELSNASAVPLDLVVAVTPRRVGAEEVLRVPAGGRATAVLPAGGTGVVVIPAGVLEPIATVRDVVTR